MENPDTWGPAEEVVTRVIAEHYENVLKPVGDRIIGLSLARQVTDALRAAGLLKEEDEHRP